MQIITRPISSQYASPTKHPDIAI